MNDILKFDTQDNSFMMKPQIKRYNPNWNIVDNIIYYQDTVEHNVVGWFYPFDQALFYIVMQDMQKNIVGDVCEIGVAFGRSAIAISNYRKPGEMFYMFDHFSDEAREDAENNIRKYGTFSDCFWEIGDTMKLSEDKLKLKNIRFLHIDGSHEHDAVLHDLITFSTKMLPEGIIVMDDYNDMEYPGVNSGILKFLMLNGDWKIFAIGHNKAYLCRSMYQIIYMKVFLDYMEQYSKYGLKFSPNLRSLNDSNVLLCCSREQKTYEEVLNNILIPVPLT